MAQSLIPAAQYLRMSTEHQQYSIENQARSIQQYAQAHGFEIARTYSDPAKSGLWLKNRLGLRELLQDVTGGGIEYKAILVYDVSRWGRFQDTDEAAHYEFLCKQAGIPVHYGDGRRIQPGVRPTVAWVRDCRKPTNAGIRIPEHHLARKRLPMMAAYRVPS